VFSGVRIRYDDNRGHRRPDWADQRSFLRALREQGTNISPYPGLPPAVKRRLDGNAEAVSSREHDARRGYRDQRC